MKVIKNNKGLILFFMAIVLFALYMNSQIEKQNQQMNCIKLQECK